MRDLIMGSSFNRSTPGKLNKTFKIDLKIIYVFYFEWESAGIDRCQRSGLQGLNSGWRAYALGPLPLGPSHSLERCVYLLSVVVHPFRSKDIPSEVKTPLHSQCRGVPLEWESYDLPEGRGAKEEQERVCMPAILWVSHILGLCVWLCHITLQGS